MVLQTIPFSTTKLKMSDVKKFEVNIDKDLVELAGNYAYYHPQIYDHIEINRSFYEVINTINDSEIGLDAFVIKNDNLIIVYVGSEQVKEDRLGTNANFT